MQPMAWRSPTTLESIMIHTPKGEGHGQPLCPIASCTSLGGWGGGALRAIPVPGAANGVGAVRRAPGRWLGGIPRVHASPGPSHADRCGGGGGNRRPGGPALPRAIHKPCAAGVGDPPPPCVTIRRVIASLRGPGQSPVLPFACCVRLLRSVGRCGRCSCWCRFRVR